MYFVPQGLTWIAAQRNCRLNNSDLASSRNETENKLLQNMINAVVPSVPTVCTGLFRDVWKWTDQSLSSFRNWESGYDGLCALYNGATLRWFSRSCAQFKYFCCYKGDYMTFIYTGYFFV